MNLDAIPGASLRNLGKLNVILGKNGCGKSHLLKNVRAHIHGRDGYGTVRYITPERGGTLRYEAGIEQALVNDPQWMIGQRTKNQSENFRQQSATLFRRLELAVLREIEVESQKPGFKPRSFDHTVDLINSLLDRVRLERDNQAVFRIVEKDSGATTIPDALSSGESELISLGIEFLAFVAECVAGKTNVLLVDEPDVHLHPDLQDKLARFIIRVLADAPATVVLATHSTALLAGLAEGGDTRVCFMRRGQTEMIFKPVSDVDRSILPIFGAHPLSNVFNQAPVLLIEGEDDERLWQQAFRSSQGRIRIFPCVVDGVTHFAEFETEVNNVIASVYDDARAYSLRDRDLQPEHIDDLGHVRRMRLACRAAENLMLADEVLGRAGITWTDFEARARAWTEANPQHQYHADMEAFVAGGLNRKDHDLKTIRNILVGLMSEKPWEVLVGQTIAHVSDSSPSEDGSLRDFLGDRVCRELLGIG